MLPAKVPRQAFDGPVQGLVVRSGAGWEIRFGPDNRFRVLYDIDEDDHAVHILAIGEKVGNRLIVGGEEVKL